MTKAEDKHSSYRYNAEGYVTGFVAPRGVGAKRVLVPSLRTVVCPVCGAEVGKTCVTDTGKPKAAHEPRRRLATRKLNQERGL